MTLDGCAVLAAGTQCPEAPARKWSQRSTGRASLKKRHGNWKRLRLSQ